MPGMQQYLIQPLKNEVIKGSMLYQYDDIDIGVSHRKQDAAIMGDSLLSMEKFFNINDRIPVL